MTLTTISKEEFTSFANTVSHRSFIQSVEMADLLEKRGNTVQFIAWKQNDQVQVAAILYSLSMTGGLHMDCLLYTSPSPRDVEEYRMPSSA